MASISFSSGTIVPASWLNDVNQVAYEPTTDVLTATGGQTAFTLSGTPRAFKTLRVFQNGLRLSPTTDYAWASGTTLTLTTGATVGDELLVEY